MVPKKELESLDHVAGFRDEIAKAATTSDDAFFTWFDKVPDKEAAFVRGNWDFMFHIAQPAAPYLPSPEGKVALEIGHGGGRILAAASNYFRQVIGVDIHQTNEKVSNELKARGIKNFRLIQTEGQDIPIEESSVDFVYSFIVLQHIEKMSRFENYLKEAQRVLKPGGIAVLYFGRKYLLSYKRRFTILYWLDRTIERFLLPKGFAELPAEINSTNLQVSMSHAKTLVRKEGFKVLAELVSRKNVPDGIALYGGQNGLVIRKI